MKILVAPNALKGSISALEAAEAMALSLPTDWQAIPCPIADGGDGTLDCLVRATGGQYFQANVSGPTANQKINARWGALGSGGTAVIEMAEAAGLRLLKPSQYEVCKATTYGVGELIRKVLDSGFRKILVGLGGSATNDGGTGCARALGARFVDSKGNDLPPGSIHLRQLAHIDLTNLDKRIEECEFVALADVNNVLFGPFGAARMFAAQKGASGKQVDLLDAAMKHYSDCLLKHFRSDVASIPGSGAAGGLGAGLIAFCHARIVSGIDYILDLIQFNDLLSSCDMVLTAEGRIDEQTLLGKGIAGIAARARKYGKPVHVFAGRVAGESEILRRQLGIESIHEITPGSVGEHEALRGAKELLKAKVKEFVQRMK